mgnify:CR=1 FL=1
MYLALDVDHNGMLSKEEFSQYADDVSSAFGRRARGTLNPVFIDRLFQECQMYRLGDSDQMEMVTLL